MPNPDLIPEPFAQSGDKNPIPLERAISDPIYRASWKAGFPPDTRIPKDIGGEPPDGLDFNGILNVLSQAVVFLQKGNAYQFDVSMAPYPIGALVRSNDNLTTYQSTVPNNSNNPNSNMSGWRIYNGSGFIVDNLTTNDSARALSAARGKVLGDRDFGVGQAWQDVTSSRFSGVTYTNNTSKPIQISIVIRDSGVFSPISLSISGVLVFSISDFNVAQYISLDKIIPAGAAYTLNAGNNPIVTWSELR
jgi:hypothetical protein